METRASTGRLVAIGVALGALIGAGAFALFGGGPPDAAPLTGAEPLGDQRAVAIEFLHAWQRFRTGTYVAELRIERTITGRDQPLVSEGVIVQAPPERLVLGWGGQTTTVDGKQQSCAFGTEDSETCAGIADKESYEVETARELSILSQYFSGNAPLYRITRSRADCFSLALYRAQGLPPYGDQAQFCFDGETGAFTLFETTSSSGRDRVVATSISPTVTEDDFKR